LGVLYEVPARRLVLTVWEVAAEERHPPLPLPRHSGSVRLGPCGGRCGVGVRAGSCVSTSDVTCGGVAVAEAASHRAQVHPGHRQVCRRPTFPGAVARRHTRRGYRAGIGERLGPTKPREAR
jgi:hypothetical protein